MATELMRAVNYCTGKDQPIKVEILAKESAVDVEPLTVIGFMRTDG